MSDEIPSHFEHRQRTKNLWLCAELWTDVFSMLSRADLVQRVEPVHRRFKEICEKKVRTIHLIRTADRFIDGLAKNMAEANQQYAHLAANDCPLAHQFRLIQMDIWVSRREAETNSAAYKRRRRFQMCVMRHSLDLFRDCRLHLQLPAQKGQLSFADSSEYLAYLNILYAPGPGSLELASLCSVPYLQMDELLRQPTVLQCNRLTLVQTPKNEPTAEAICHWIHWICPIAAQPTEAGKQEEKEEEEEAEGEAEVGLLELLNFDIGQLRCLNILASSSPVLNSIEEVLDRCIQNLLQAERPSDRRPFVLSFCFLANQPLKELHVQNLSSAEVLLLENVESPDTGLPTANYRLSRWPIAQLGQMPEFNGRLFRSFGKFKSGSAAIEPTLVQIT